MCVTNHPRTVRQAESSFEIHERRIVVKGAARGFHPYQCPGEIGLIAKVTLPLDDFFAIADVTPLRSVVRFRRIGLLETGIIPIGERANDVPVANGILRFTQPQRRPGAIVEFSPPEAKLISFTLQCILNMSVRQGYLVRFRAKIPRAVQHYRLDGRECSSRAKSLAVGAQRDFNALS